jgi:hypothetical protein
MADETGAPPVDVSVAPVAAPVDTPLSHEELLAEIRQLSPDEARAVHDAYVADFHAPASAPLVPSTSAEAARRLEQLAQTPGYLQKLEAGDYETMQEFRRLTALKAQATPFDPAADGAPDWSSGPGLGNQLSRSNTIDAASHLRGKGCSDDEIGFILSDQKYPTPDVDAAHYWLPRLQADPSLEVPDLPPGRSRADFMNFLQRIISIGSN